MLNQDEPCKLIFYGQLHLRHQHLASLHKFQAKAFRKSWASTPANARSSISKKLGTASANPLRNFSEKVYDGTCMAKMLWLPVELFLLPRTYPNYPAEGMVRIFEIQFPLDRKSFHVSMLFYLGRTSTNFKQRWVFLSTSRVPASDAFLFLKHAVFLLNQFTSFIYADVESANALSCHGILTPCLTLKALLPGLECSERAHPRPLVPVK